MMRGSISALFTFSLLFLCGAEFFQTPTMPYPGDIEKRTEFWREKGLNWLQKAISNLHPEAKTNAKNVILFIGDGMGIPIVTASRIFRGQSQRLISEQTPFSFEKFPFAGLSRTYSVDRHVTDSAASATAFLSGISTKKLMLGTGPEANLQDCSSGKQYTLKSIADWAIEEGKSVGVVTTARMTHATPGALYAHIVNRNYENDMLMDRWKEEKGSKIDGCKDIARQLIEDAPGKYLKVMLGGGRKSFQPEPNGVRTEGDLIQKWLKLGGKRQFVENRRQLSQMDFDNTDYLLGLFSQSHMNFELTKQPNSSEPNLVQMTEAAIKILQKNPKGFFLLVEGGMIDIALHYNWAKGAMMETIWLDKAVDKAQEMTNLNDTMMVVTADHSHSMSIVGYPNRNVSILGHFHDDNTKLKEEIDKVLDGLPAPILVFANGNKTDPRRNLSEFDTEANSFRQPAFIPRNYDTHSGEDVGIYSKGPGAQILTGTIELPFIALAMSYALCIGPGKDLCLQRFERPQAVQSRIVETGPDNSLVVAALIVGVLCLLGIIVIALLLIVKIQKKSKSQNLDSANVAYRNTSFVTEP